LQSYDPAHGFVISSFDDDRAPVARAANTCHIIDTGAHGVRDPQGHPVIDPDYSGQSTLACIHVRADHGGSEDIRMPEIEVFVPVPPTRVTRMELAPRRATLEGATVGWCDNRKANAAALLHEIAAAWRDAGRNFKEVWAAKNATAAAPDAVMAHLLTCDAVVLAIAD
jgi:hypothetical protein